MVTSSHLHHAAHRILDFESFQSIDEFFLVNFPCLPETIRDVFGRQVGIESREAGWGTITVLNAFTKALF